MPPIFGRSSSSFLIATQMPRQFEWKIVFPAESVVLLDHAAVYALIK
jgi:hypothetical protein